MPPAPGPVQHAPSTRAPRSTRAVALVLVLGVASACGAKRDERAAKDGTPPATPAPAAKPTAAPRGSAAPGDYSRVTLARGDDSVAGVGFAIELPGGLSREVDGPSVSWAWPDAPLSAPMILVTLLDLPAPTTLDDAVFEAKLTGDPELVVDTQREVPGGFLVSVHTPDDRYLGIDLWRTRGDKALKCGVTHRQAAEEPPIPNRAATAAWAEQVCLSLAPR